MIELTFQVAIFISDNLPRGTETQRFEEEGALKSHLRLFESYLGVSAPLWWGFYRDAIRPANNAPCCGCHQ